jgi:RNA polymerase sigma-70 factor, ECF subfamily
LRHPKLDKQPDVRASSRPACTDLGRAVQNEGVTVVTPQAFEDVFDEHGATVLAYLLRRTSRENAEDLLSETFLTFWRKYGGARMPDEPVPFLLAIARRLLANQRRSDARRTALHERIAREPAAAAPDAHDQLAGSGVLDALAQLSEQDREVLLLDAWEQLSGPEAARVLGCREGTYRQRLRRARERMAVLLEQAGGADPQGAGATTGGRR